MTGRSRHRFGVGLLVLGGFLVFYDPAEEYEPGVGVVVLATEFVVS